jgi:hypothetical protein
MRHVYCFLGIAWLSAISALPAAHSSENDERINHGRYLVKIGGCNECHTEGYARTFGKIPESEWMIGREWGEVGPWGTTFPVNVRLLVAEINEREWIDRVPAGDDRRRSACRIFLPSLSRCSRKTSSGLFAARRANKVSPRPVSCRRPIASAKGTSTQHSNNRRPRPTGPPRALSRASRLVQQLPHGRVWSRNGRRA